MNLPDTICMLPWISVETSPMGTARPCCLAQEEITNEQGVAYTLKNNSVIEIYNSQYMKNLRQSFRKGEKPSTCSRCWNEESAGRDSKRIHSKVRLKELYKQVDWQSDSPDQLWFLDLKLGNICNLKCRICGSWSSSKWAAEEMDYLPSGIDKKQHIAYKWLKQGRWPEESPDFWQELKTILPNVKYIEFTGGEPWMIKEHWDLLHYADQQGLAKNIDIHYNTNATQLPENLDIWKNFGRVDIAFSIDNVGKRFEYERYGADWNKANQIIDLIHKAKKESNSRITTQLCFTINIQNVYYLDELLTWADTKNFGSIYFNVLHSPEHMNVMHLTATAKQVVIEKLTSVSWNSPYYKKEIDNLIRFIDSGPGSDGKTFIELMKRTDAYRKQNFMSTHTEIAEAMGYE